MQSGLSLFSGELEIDEHQDCARILLPEKERRSYLRDLRLPNIDSLRQAQIFKKISAECRKVKTCYSCGVTNGKVKKAGQHPLKIIHDRYSAYNSSPAMKKVAPKSKRLFDESFSYVRKNNSEIDKHIKKAVDDMNPLRVLNLFKRVTSDDCELLGMNPTDGGPELLLWQFIPAPPACIRPSVPQD